MAKEYPSPSPAPPSHLPSVTGMVKGSPAEVVNGIQVSSTKTHTKRPRVHGMAYHTGTHTERLSAVCYRRIIKCLSCPLQSLMPSIPLPGRCDKPSHIAEPYISKPQNGETWEAVCFDVTTTASTEDDHNVQDHFICSPHAGMGY